MKVNFTPEQDEMIIKAIGECRTQYELQARFNAAFPMHQITYSNLGKRMQKIGVKMGTHNIRPECVPHRNEVGTVICSNGKSARVKTARGYVSANNHYLESRGIKGKRIVHLDGDCTNFRARYIEIVEPCVYHSLCWRGWFFKEADLTRTAILAARLLLMFPKVTHNENQYLVGKWIDDGGTDR